MALDFLLLAHQCAPDVHVDTITRIASVESAFNPFAIGVVDGNLKRQPRNLREALATVNELESKGFNYSVGLVQVNKKNFPAYGLTPEIAFDPCTNLNVGGRILTKCFIQALKVNSNKQKALKNAFSCYYSGNFLTGYEHGYVAKLIDSYATVPPVIPLSSQPIATETTQSANARASKKTSKPNSTPSFTQIQNVANATSFASKRANKESAKTALLF
jgi:type IV secretion system protein VirB1